MRKAESVFHRIVTVFITAGAVSIIIMAILVGVDVGIRLTLGNPIKGSYELIQLLFSVSVFTALIAAQKWKSHIQISLFVKLLPQKFRFPIIGAVSLLGPGISGIIMMALFRQAAKASNIGTITDVLKIPLAPFYGLFGFLMAVFTVQLAIDTAKSFAAIKNKSLAKGIEDAWI